MDDYFFTVTLLPIMYKKDIDKQYDDTANELYVSLKILSEKITLVAELSRNFNVHYHGIIRLDGSKRKFVNMFRGDKKFGFVNLSLIKSAEKVYAYISKDIKISTEELGRRVIIHDDYNVFSTRDRMLYGCSF